MAQKKIFKNDSGTPRTKVKLAKQVQQQNVSDGRNEINLARANGSGLSNVMTLKPPSPTPYMDPRSLEIGEVLEQDNEYTVRN